LLADAIHRFGYDVVRGFQFTPGAKRNSSPYRNLASDATGHHARRSTRPAYELGPGIFFLAQKSDALVLPMNLEYSRLWRLEAGIALSSRNHFRKFAC